MTDPITIMLLGAPVPWARAGSRGSQRYTPKKQRNNAATLRLAAHQAMVDCNSDILDQAVALSVHAEFEIPKSWSRRKRNEAITGQVRHTKKPDLSNIIKQAEDAIRGVVYSDDAVIDTLRARKRYGLQPKLVITVTPIGGE